MAWHKTVRHNYVNDIDNNDNDNNTHSHREQHSHTAPKQPLVTGSCHSWNPIREIGGLGLCPSASNPTRIIGECAYQFILFSGFESKNWQYIHVLRSIKKLSIIYQTYHTLCTQWGHKALFRTYNVYNLQDIIPCFTPTYLTVKGLIAPHCSINWNVHLVCGCYTCVIFTDICNFYIISLNSSESISFS